MHCPRGVPLRPVRLASNSSSRTLFVTRPALSHSQPSYPARRTPILTAEDSRIANLVGRCHSTRRLEQTAAPHSTCRSRTLTSRTSSGPHRYWESALLYIGSFRLPFVRLSTSSCFRLFALHYTFLFCFWTFYHRALPYLPHPHCLCAHCRARCYYSVKFQHFGRRCSSSTSPCGSVSGRTTFVFVFLLSTPLAHHCA